MISLAPAARWSFASSTIARRNMLASSSSANDQRVTRAAVLVDHDLALAVVAGDRDERRDVRAGCASVALCASPSSHGSDIATIAGATVVASIRKPQLALAAA